MEFDELLGQVMRSSYEALEHQNYPFDLLVRQLEGAARAEARPFLDVVYAFQNSPDVRPKVGAELPQSGPGPVQSLGFAFAFAKFDLSLVVVDHGRAGISLTLEYDSDLFKGKTVEGYLNALDRFARQIAARPA
jgi:non-ribosomal peptide synthetase component F